MLGNSFTAANGLPERLGALLGAEVVAHVRGGARLAEHLNQDTRLGGLTQAALATGGFDFVVMQEMSNAPITTPERFCASVEALAGQVRAAGATPVLFETWAYAPDGAKLARLGLSYDEMADALRDSYREAARRADCELAEVGEAFRAAEARDALYSSDGTHPSEVGSILAAETLARALSS